MSVRLLLNRQCERWHPEMRMSIASKGDIEGLAPQLVLSIAMSLGVVMHEWMAPLRSAYMADT